MNDNKEKLQRLFDRTVELMEKEENYENLIAQLKELLPIYHFLDEPIIWQDQGRF